MEDLRTTKHGYDFREMTKVNKALMKKSVKRLQQGPKKSNQDPTKLQPEVVVDMDKLLQRLMRDDVDLVMPSNKKKTDMKKIVEKVDETTREIDCINMLHNLEVGERREIKKDDDENKDDEEKITEKKLEVREDKTKEEEEMPKKSGGN